MESDDMRQPYAFSAREGDGDVFPGIGKPKLISGEVKPVTGTGPLHGKDDYEDTEELRREVSNGFLSFFGWTCFVLALLWIFTFSSPFLANALTLHGWRFWGALALAVLPAASVLGLLLYVLVRLRTLPRVEQFSESAFGDRVEALHSRLATCYISHIADPQKYAEENGFAAKGDDLGDMPVVTCLKRLRGDMPAQCSGSEGWLLLFKEFQAMQDKRADEIIAKTWKLVALKTAASPWKIVDMLAVVYNSTMMIMRLARLYNRRSSRRAAFRLACRWIMNIYVAGEMGEAMQGAVEWASARDFISATYKPLASLFGKVAEGGANALLVYRLGCRAVAYFRPLVWEGTRLAARR